MSQGCLYYLGAIEACSHTANVGAGKFSRGLNCLEHALRFRERRTTIDRHDAIFGIYIRIKQIFDVDTSRSENLSIREQNLRFQSLTFSDESVAIVFPRRDALQNNCIKQLRVKNHGVLRNTKWQIIRLESRSRLARKPRITADGASGTLACRPRLRARPRSTH